MSTDENNNSENNKTVFRQSSPASNHTVMKPVPGGRIPSPYGTNTNQTINTINPVAQNYTMDSEIFRKSRGLNPLVNAASVLLAVFEKTRNAVSHSDVEGLYRSLVNEIKLFEENAKEQAVSSEIVLSARYILCTILDEAVLNTPWGCESAWTQRTLLSTFHNEASGGEKFFVILDRLRENPSDNIVVLELFYLCLSLGFQGKYQLDQRGSENINAIRNELFSIIRTFRGDYERGLSTDWQGLGQIKNPLSSYVPLWVVASLVAALLIFSYSGFRYWLYNSSGPMVAKFDNITKPIAVNRNKARRF